MRSISEQSFASYDALLKCVSRWRGLAWVTQWRRGLRLLFVRSENDDRKLRLSLIGPSFVLRHTHLIMVGLNNASRHSVVSAAWSRLLSLSLSLYLVLSQLLTLSFEGAFALPPRYRSLRPAVWWTTTMESRPSAKSMSWIDESAPS